MNTATLTVIAFLAWSFGAIAIAIFLTIALSPIFMDFMDHFKDNR